MHANAERVTAAGTPHTVFPTSFDELLRHTGGRPADAATST